MTFEQIIIYIFLFAINNFSQIVSIPIGTRLFIDDFSISIKINERTLVEVLIKETIDRILDCTRNHKFIFQLRNL